MTPVLKKPILIFDGECGFCRRWIERWKLITGDRLDYAPFQEVGARFPEITREQFEAGVQFVDRQGDVSSNAEAVFQSLAIAPQYRFLLTLYQSARIFRWGSEAFYRFVAAHRIFFSRLTWMFWGEEVTPSTFYLSRWIYLKALGLIYLAAFVSLYSQLPGLVGEHGILGSPLGEAWARPAGALGILSALFLTAGVFPWIAASIAWGCYLFLTWVCADFLAFQWDSLLLEMGFLALFLIPWSYWTGGLGNAKNEEAPSRVALWLYRWLWFRVLFFSGYVKLQSGDHSWRDLTALQRHFETQPLPTWVGYFMHQLPLWALQVATVGMFVVELIVPFLVFLPRIPRIVAAISAIGLMVLIDTTGNYGFFGFQMIALSLLLFDDAFYGRLFQKVSLPSLVAVRPPGKLRTVLASAFAIVVLLITFLGFERLEVLVEPFRFVNRYGVFAVMTTQRPEIVLEGSEDGHEWRPYEFKWKPGAVDRRPRFMEPHMPRLDWQMWFAALGDFESNVWFQRFCLQLLKGSPEVLSLMEGAPFGGRPPRYLRAQLYEYRFTSWDELKKTGHWWSRKLKGPFSPALTVSAPGQSE